MNLFEFLLPTRIVFGNDVLNNICTEASLFGTKAFIITDKGVEKTGYIERIQELLTEGDINSTVFSDIDTNPKDSSVHLGYKQALQYSPDLLIGVGGGSAIDTAKAIGVLLQEGGKIQDYEGLEKVTKPITPLIAVPTTAGTGSEVTFWSVITDTKRSLKMSIGSPLMAAHLALVDPMLTLSLPKNVTAFTGVDALVHAIEGYTATLSQPISESLALSAIELISQNIRKAYANPNHVEARKNMMLGSMMAGIAFGNSDVASVHCMGEAMGGLYDVPHGLSMAVCLPYCMEYNIIANPEKYANITKAFGENIQGYTPLEAAHKGIDSVKSLLQDLDIPNGRSIGLKKEDLQKLAVTAAANVSVESNPRVLDEQDFVILFNRLYKGE